MKRSGPLRRSSALQRRAAMRRHPTAMRSSSAKRRTDSVTTETREEIARRDMGCVGARLIDGACWGPIDPHHILRRSQGGTNDAANLVTLCRAHHDWVHAHPAAAIELGLLRRSGES